MQRHSSPPVSIPSIAQKHACSKSVTKNGSNQIGDANKREAGFVQLKRRARAILCNLHCRTALNFMHVPLSAVKELVYVRGAIVGRMNENAAEWDFCAFFKGAWRAFESSESLCCVFVYSVKSSHIIMLLLS